ncbi:MAG: bifunctional (p)ppGpp synthetase/guanosine-3',5'-bis(diphosphate) 3'-pyrophosphohydrolase [Ruminococcus sp.]|nr:bifunctional (p)ppGpp synthetase/guanosine-3',5'-bis(diphosphate) 3'-pyrophosphohydrolase [Ruminococcus sp.]
MEEPVYTIDAFIEKITKEDKKYDLDKIVHAYEVANELHKDQFRDSGEPYISHPLAVAFIALSLGMDTDTICAALLHDTVEDTPYTLEELSKDFGADVAMLVDGVTKLGKIPMATKEEQQAENIRKIILATSEDIRVILIKLCDRLHNMRTLKYRKDEKRRATALETMNIYAPLAHRLGIRPIKEELEDRAFQFLDPYAYEEIDKQMLLQKDERVALIDSIKQKITDRLKQDFDPVPYVDGRVKSIYGIYKKVYRDGKDLDQIYDKYAVRIIVNNVTECYAVLGIIHDMFRPIPNRFKDYISTPKSNMYQSLHTTVIGTEGIIFEVQIRTWEMHHTAEFGVAAHWKYKEGITGRTKNDARLEWIRKILEAQKESDDVEEIVRTIKTDLAPEDVFAYTPRGDMISLPLGATVIDFAYAIHTQVGHKMTGAKVDGKMVSIDHQIKTGEIVEIITSKDENHGPSRSWLKICKTNEAKSKIRSWFKKEKREENIFEGRNELRRELKRNLIHIDDEKELYEFLETDIKRHNCETLDDFYAAIGYGGVTLSKLMPRLKQNYQKKYGPQKSPTPEMVPFKSSRKASNGIIVDGIDDCAVKFAKCCTPLPGDDVIGFITKGHGISVHKKDCVNYQTQKDIPELASRWVSVSWAEERSTTYFSATLDIVAHDRIGLMADIVNTVSMLRIQMHEATGRELKNGNANVIVTVSVAGKEQLESLMQKLRKIDSVISVDRSNKQ